MREPSTAYMVVILKEYESKLIEIMGGDEYYRYAREVAKKAFRAEVESMEDSEFKQFCLDNFEIITED